jgi:ferredoxin--NADP+ reductase
VRIAVIGSGPAGVYAVQALLGGGLDADVDVIDLLPAPFGLVRYGVAPDHPKIKSISRVLHRVLESPRVRFLGNVRYGVDLTAEDLRRHYHAVIHASGTPGERRLGIPGEDLPSSRGAAEFVAWYNGHPGGPFEFPLAAGAVAVVGAGNVALDAVRMLATEPAELGRTDVPDAVLAAFRDNRATDVYLLARRGPQHAKFTTPELRELGALDGVDVLVPPEDLPAEDPPGAERTVRNNLAALRGWAERGPTGAPRRIHLRFWRRPAEILGAGDVTGLVAERMVGVGDGRVTGTGEHETFPVQAVLRAVGYGGAPVPGLPFDSDTGTVPHDAGRVVDPATGRPVTGAYVAGWIKRGPIGVIGTNKADAAETVRSLVADAPGLPEPAEPDPGAVPALLAARGVPYTTWDGWLRLADEEARAGATQGRPSAKIVDMTAMLRICRGG